jgi:hypothetical protein
MLFVTITSTTPGTRRPAKEHHRATPSGAFLDYDPILPGWPTPEGGLSADAHDGVRQRRRRRRAKRRSKLT